jgi:hypothetical protein
VQDQGRVGARERDELHVPRGGLARFDHQQLHRRGGAHVHRAVAAQVDTFEKGKYLKSLKQKPGLGLRVKGFRV